MTGVRCPYYGRCACTQQWAVYHMYIETEHSHQDFPFVTCGPWCVLGRCGIEVARVRGTQGAPDPDRWKAERVPAAGVSGIPCTNRSSTGHNCQEEPSLTPPVTFLAVRMLLATLSCRRFRSIRPQRNFDSMASAAYGSGASAGGRQTFSTTLHANRMLQGVWEPHSAARAR